MKFIMFELMKYSFSKQESRHFFSCVTSASFWCEGAHEIFLCLSKQISERELKSNVYFFSVHLKYVTWSRGMSWMSLILFLRYRLKEVINSYVLFCLGTSKNLTCISTTGCPTVMGFGSKWGILKGLVVNIENWKNKFCQHVTHFPWSCHTYEDKILSLLN